MSQNYHGIILDAEFKDPKFADQFQIFAKRRSRNNPWILYGVAVEPSKIKKIIRQIQENLKINAPYYAHFYRDGELIVVFKEKVFRITQDKSTWANAQKYGRSLGIPKEQLNFFCVSFNKEKEYWGEENFINQEPHIHTLKINVCAT